MTVRFIIVRICALVQFLVSTSLKNG